MPSLLIKMKRTRKIMTGNKTNGWEIIVITQRGNITKQWTEFFFFFFSSYNFILTCVNSSKAYEICRPLLQRKCCWSSSEHFASINPSNCSQVWPTISTTFRNVVVLCSHINSREQVSRETCLVTFNHRSVRTTLLTTLLLMFCLIVNLRSGRDMDSLTRAHGWYLQILITR